MSKKRYGLSIAHEHVNQLKPKVVKPTAAVHVEKEIQTKPTRKLIKWENLHPVAQKSAPNVIQTLVTGVKANDKQ